VLVFAVGCGRAPLGRTAGDSQDDGAAPEVGGAAAKRAPLKHRAAAVACPAVRAAGMLEACPPGGLQGVATGNCRQDADCTKGPNGRCNKPTIGPSTGCDGVCTYDDCLDDSGCGAAAPCQCRTSEASGTPNTCESDSDCRVDADCGPGGFCSPSVVEGACDCLDAALCDPSEHLRCTVDGMDVPCECGDACGHGYFCHTPDDACLDDADCAGKGGTCNFDRLRHRWTCSFCSPVL
jgi:hypothetical protein